MVTQRTIRHIATSLSGRLVIGIAITQILLMPLLLGSVLYYVNNTLKEQFISDIRATAGLITSTLTPINPVTQREQAISLLDEIILSGNIVYADIILPNDNVISSFLDGQNGDLVFIEDLEFDKHNDQVYFIALPILLSGYDTAAILRIGFDELPLNEQLNKISSYLFAIIFIYSLINLILVFYLGERTTMPLNKLRQASRQIRHGHVDVNLDIESPVSDVRDLAIDLDLMRQELVSQASALEYQAMHDALTALPNRVLFDDRLQQTILSNSRTHEQFSLLLIDMDRFKQVNDTFGHQAGDELLRQVAMRLSDIVRKEDTVARLGGDEFAVLLQSEKNMAHRVAQAIVQEMQRPFKVEDQSLHVGASIGIVHFPEHSGQAEDLMRQADIAMYEAKSSDSHYQLYNPSHDTQTHDRLTLCNDFNKAIQEREIILHYQPKIDLETGAFNGVEALARWQHPERGLLSPDHFISFAESSGLIRELTNCLLEIAINDAAIWYHSGQAIEVSLNLSPKNLLDNDLPLLVERLLSEKNLPAEYLSLEITENAIIREPEQARDNLLTLKAMGVRSIIDDFGTGYSSLLYLRHLPVNEIKIDKSFVIDMLLNKDDAQIVKAIIRMGHDLELLVTAEGVESAEAANQLKALKCDKGQGFHYSKALPLDELNTWHKNYNLNRKNAPKETQAL